MRPVSALVPELQAWLRLLEDAELIRTVGATTFTRGESYSRTNVLLAGTDDDGTRLLGRVLGSKSQLHHVAVDVEFGSGGRPAGTLAVAWLPSTARWSSSCSCPLVSDCKHVVAVLLNARRTLLKAAGALATLPARPGLAQPAGWERLLAPLAAAEQVQRAPLAFQVELHVSTGRWSGQRTTLQLRPMTRGTRGNWIKTGVSWEDLRSGHERIELHPQHRALARQFRITAESTATTLRYGTLSTLDLAELGPDLWRLLQEASRVGIELIPGPGLSEIALAAEPATVSLRVQTAAEDVGGVLLMPELRIDGESAQTRAPVLIGTPAHACFVLEDDLPPTAPGAPPRLRQPDRRVLLARLEPPLDDSVAALFTAGRIAVPAADVPRLAGSYLPSLRRRVPITGDVEALREPEIVGPLLAITLSYGPAHRLEVVHRMRYLVDGRPVDLKPTGAGGALEEVVEGFGGRDVDAELDLVGGLSALLEVPGLVVGPEHRRRLVARVVVTGTETARYAQYVLPQLISDDRVLVTRPEGLPDYTEVDEPPLITVAVHDPAHPLDNDWFDLAVTVHVGGEEVPFRPLFAALVQGRSHLILISGTWFSLNRPELRQLRDLIEEARILEDPQGTGLQLNRVQIGLWEELVGLGVVASQSARWQQSVGSLLALEETPDPEPPQHFKAELRPYQRRGYAWLSLLWDHNLGGLLADDMGLGKTVQVLAMAQRARERGDLTAPLLVVSPTSVIGTWAEQAAEFCPELRVATVLGTARRREQSVTELAANCDLLITSYTLLRLEAEEYHQIAWAGMVLDEAQAVKNYRARTYQDVRKVPARFKLAVTGTPLENSLMDLWALLSIVAPGLYPDPEAFTLDYRRPIEQNGDQERLARLRRRIRPLMLRRRKSEVAPDLPAKIEQMLPVELNAAHRRVYNRQLQRERQRVLGMLTDVQRNRMAIFRSLTRLRQLALAPELVDPDFAGVSPSKLDVLLEHLQEVLAEGHRALIFSQFTGFLGLLKKRLDALGIGYQYLDGRTRDRPRRIAAFREGEDPLFLISLKAGGFGLTLTEADYVYVLDPWWNPAAEEQAVDRTHRIGQTNPVNVYRLVSAGTIEEKVVALQERKRKLFGDVVEGEASAGGVLSAEDIRELLRG